MRILILAICIVVCLAGPANASCPSTFTIAIDVGHSKAAPGAISARGRSEFSFNLKLARAFAAAIARRQIGRTEVLVSNGTSSAASLAKRVSDAAAIGADLFVSVHHDSVQPQYLQPWTFGAKRGLFSDKFSGYSLFVSRKSGQPEMSLGFARHFSERLHKTGQHFSPHHAEAIEGESRPWADADNGVYWFDGLAVLRTQKIPAVLFEAGIIVNRRDEIALASKAHREKTADSFAGAVEAYCTSSLASREPR